MQYDPVNEAAHDLTDKVSDREGEKITLMGLIRNENTQGVVGVATFLLMILTAILFGTILSDIRNDVKSIKIETQGNTMQVGRIQEQIRWMERRLDHLEKEIENELE
jgi:hypothetical protein